MANPPVRDILLDDDGNRVLVGNDYGFASGGQAVKQGTASNLRLLLGEVWFDQSQGVPYTQRILIANYNVLEIRGYLSAAIIATPDVTQVVQTSFTVDPVTREAFTTYTAASPFGPVSNKVSAP